MRFDYIEEGFQYLEQNDFDELVVQATHSNGVEFSRFTVTNDICEMEGITFAVDGCDQLEFDLPAGGRCEADTYVLTCTTILEPNAPELDSSEFASLVLGSFAAEFDVAISAIESVRKQAKVGQKKVRFESRMARFVDRVFAQNCKVLAQDGEVDRTAADLTFSLASSDEWIAHMTHLMLNVSKNRDCQRMERWVDRLPILVCRINKAIVGNSNIRTYQKC